MKKWLMGAAVALFCLNVFAAPVRKAMVLAVSGPVVAHPFANSNEKVVTGQMWSEGCQVDVPAGASLTVLMLSKGERLKIEGGGKFSVAAEGLVLQGCKSTVLASNQHKLSLTGENHRQIGGVTVRSDMQTVDGWLDRVAVAPEGVTVSMPAGAGNPPALEFEFYYSYGWPNISRDLQRVFLPDRGMKYASPLIEGKTEGSRWVWTAPWPAEKDAPQTSGLRVDVPRGKESLLPPRPQLDPDRNRPDMLYTRVARLTPADLQELEEARAAAEAWSAQEPSSPQPWVVYANLLDEKCCLEEANQVLERALALQPDDEGLRQMKSRVLVDLGRYGQAVGVLKRK